MKTYYYFNADHDLALANGSNRYDAPISAQKLIADLSTLPAWYADGGTIITPSEVPSSWGCNIFQQLSLKVDFISIKQFEKDNQPSDKLNLWGWNRAVCSKLHRQAIYDIDEYKRMASRSRCISLLQDIKDEGYISDEFCVPIECSSEKETYLAIERFDNKAVIKAPWSGSGKGLTWVSGALPEQTKGHLKRILSQQGSIICEKIFNKKIDFAMEFRMENKKCSFAGYSLFKSDGKGTYRGNILASDSEIERCLSKHVDLENIENKKNFLQKWFEKNFSIYEGFLGVDMMIYEEDGMCFLHPCVEINLRMNMGVVCRLFYDKYAREGSVGEYSIIHGKNSSELLNFSKKMSQEYPLKIENGRIETGFLQMTYVGNDSEYMAYSLFNSDAMRGKIKLI